MQTWIIAALGLGINVIVLVVTVTVAISNLKLSIVTSIESAKEELEQKLYASENANGETARVLRTKINEVELYLRDNYVRRDSFALVQQQISKDFANFSERVETRLERMEQKIDTKN